MGMPPVIMTTTIDQAHSPHCAVGYMFSQIQPRLAMVTHTSYDEELIPEITAGIRVHYSGLFQFGAPDVVVVNITKDAIWTRKAALPDAGNMTRPSPADAVELFGLSATNLKVTFPNARRLLADNVEADILNSDIDPKKYLSAGRVSPTEQGLSEGLHDRCPRHRPREGKTGEGQALGQEYPNPGRHRRN